MWARSSLGEVEDIDHREEGGVQRVEHKMRLVPAAIFHLQTANKRDIVISFNLRHKNHQMGIEEGKATWFHVVTQQESSMTSGSSSPPASKTSPLQALNLTDAWPAGRFSSGCQTEKFRQWMMTCCTASELSRCRKFNWTRPTLISGCSNRQNRSWLPSASAGYLTML